MAAATMGVGLIVAGSEIQSWLDDQLGEESWTIMQKYHAQVIGNGLNATEPFPGFLEGLLNKMEKGLQKRGFGEETFLKPLYKRVNKRENPAQEAQRVFRQFGMDALIQKLRCSG